MAGIGCGGLDFPLNVDEGWSGVQGPQHSNPLKPRPSHFPGGTATACPQGGERVSARSRGRPSCLLFADC